MDSETAPTAMPAARGDEPEALLERLDVRRLALAIAVGILLLVGLGGLRGLARDESWAIRLPAFGLDEEWSVPAFFSGGLLFAAAAAAVLVTSAAGLPAVRAGVLRGLAAFFAFMGLDEIVQIHERLESLAHVGWQRLYLPLMAVGGGLWLIVLRGLTVRRDAAAAFVAGAAAWVVAQLFELVQRDGAVLA